MPIDNVPPPQGFVRIHHVSECLAVKSADALAKKLRWRTEELPNGWMPKTGWTHNDVLYEWGAIVGPLLLRQGLNYGVSGMYIEFENTASPGDPVDVPTVSRDADQGVDYYNALVDSADRDYLRIPLIAGSLRSTDVVKFPIGNAPTFFAMTSGVEGVHGKPFSYASNSVVFGGALVAFVDDSDPTQDLVFSRFYLEVALQQAKLDTSQIGFEWQLRLK